MEKTMTPFLNLRSDFGFKHTFGSEKNKPAIIRLLNALFDGQLRVTDVVYHDKEILPADKDGKRIVYDVYCTSLTPKVESQFMTAYDRLKKKEDSRDHHFILEMQNVYNPPFEERLTFYGARMVAEQGKEGWDYALAPVFVIAVMNFNFSHMSPKLMHDVMLMDRDTREPLTEKVHFYLCSLKEVPEKWEECRTEVEKALYLIKNMEHMDSTSAAYRSGEFNEFFTAARSNTLNPEEVVAYSQSLDKLRENERGIWYAAEMARAEALAEGEARGEAKGRAEGRAENSRMIARMAKAMGKLSIADIAAITGLTEEEVEKL